MSVYTFYNKCATLSNRLGLIVEINVVLISVAEAMPVLRRKALKGIFRSGATEHLPVATAFVKFTY